MKYYIDRVWFDVNHDTWIIYECPIEKYEVVEVEEWEGILFYQNITMI